MATPFRLATEDFQLASGDIIPIGMNFFALKLMTKYPGGLQKLKANMEAMAMVDQESEAYSEAIEVALDALSHMLWALMRAGGTVCDKDDCAMAIGLEDFPKLHQIFTEFVQRAEKMSSKNAARPAM